MYKQFKCHRLKFTLIAGLLIHLPPVQAEDTFTDSHVLTVMGFNIWDKGHKSKIFDAGEAEKGHFVYNKTMRDLLTGVSPDVLVIPELYHKNNAEVHIRNTLDILNSLPHKPGNYRKPEGKSKMIAGGVFEATGINTILMKPGNGFPHVFIEGIHLSFLDEPTYRIREAEHLIQNAGKRDFPTILVGDFNAGDITERGLLRVDAQIRLMKNNNEGVLRRENENFYSRLAREYIAAGDETRVREIVQKYNPDSDIDQLSWQQWGKALETARNNGEHTGLTDETYPVELNLPRTLNTLRKQFQLMQLERNRALFYPGIVGDGRATWTSDGEAHTNIWPGWDRANIDHVLVSRPFAKWTEIVDNGKYSGTLSQVSKRPDGHSLSDHEPVAQQLRWTGPLLESYTNDEDGEEKIRLIWGREAYNFSGRNREFCLTRNNMRDDLYLGQISDADGFSVLKDLPVAVKKMRFSCKSRSPYLQQAVSDYCIDDHGFIDEVLVKDGGMLIVDEDAALGDKNAKLHLADGGVRITGTDMKRLDRDIAIEKAGWLDVADVNNTVSLPQKVSGAGALIKQGPGVLVLNNLNHYTGGTLVDGGILRAGHEGALVRNTHFTVNAGALDLGGFDLSMSALSGHGGTVLIGDATLDINQNKNTRFNGDLRGEGKLIKRGAGSLTLNGDNAVGSGITISGGALIIGDAENRNAVLNGPVRLEKHTLLGGYGNIGTLSAGHGSCIAPGGDTAGTLTINGDLTLEPGTVYKADISPAGMNDHLSVTGKAQLTNALLYVDKLPGKYTFGTRYTVLTANNGIEGHFGYQKLPDLHMPFAEAGLSYSPGSVDISIIRNSTPFEVASLSNNQRAVARALERLSTDSQVYRAVASQSGKAGARKAFDALSGETYASVKTSMINDSNLVRHVIFDRLYRSPGNPVSENHPASGGAWGQITDSWSRNTGSDAAAVNSLQRGVFVGYDGTIADGWRPGVFAGYNRNNISINDRDTSAISESWHLGLYSRNEWQIGTVKTGLSRSWHNLSAERQVIFPDFSESLSSDWKGTTAQVFGEFSRTWYQNDTAAEPFVRIAAVRNETDGFREKKGHAALTVKASSTTTTFGTAGVRFSSSVITDSIDAKLNGTVGWIHAMNDRNPVTKASLGNDRYFESTGVSVPKDSVVVNAGISITLWDKGVFNVNYSGQHASEFSQNSYMATLSISL